MPKIAFRVDNSVAIGTGHLTRCLTLADELRHMGAEIHFVCRHITSFMRQQLESRGYALSILPALEEQPGDLAHAAWLRVSQEADAAATVAALAEGAPWDWLVVDHYALDARWETIIRGSAKQLMVIDDLADRFHLADLLLDQNLQNASPDRYANLLPQSTRRLIGPRFALLRPEFHEAAPRPNSSKQQKRLNIFFGGTDPKGMTVVALKALTSMNREDIAIDVIVGIDNPHREAVTALCRQLPNTTLHIQPADIERLFASADLALGAGGTTSWERCCLGLPTLIISVAENQRHGSAALAKACAAIDLGPMEAASPARILETVTKLLSKPRTLAQMRRRATALVDGRGAQRVALCLMRGTVRVRPAHRNDAKAKWIWRNDSRTRKYFNDPNPVSWPTHEAWWIGVLSASDRSMLIAHCEDVDVGVLRFDYTDHNAIVSIYLDPELGGLGLGSAVLRAGVRWILDARPATVTLVAEIDPQNSTSRHGFAAAGFRNENDREWVYDLHG